MTRNGTSELVFVIHTCVAVFFVQVDQRIFIIRILFVQSGDYDTYTCVGQNSLGAANATVQLFRKHDILFLVDFRFGYSVLLSF